MIEKLFIVLSIAVLYLIDRIFIKIFSTREYYYILELLLLFITGIILGIDKLKCFEKQKRSFNMKRFTYIVIPLIVFFVFEFGIVLITFLNPNINIILPLPLLSIWRSPIYRLVGSVSLGYFLITSFNKYENE